MKFCVFIFYLAWNSNSIIIATLLTFSAAKMHAKNNRIHYLATRIASVATHIWYLRHHLDVWFSVTYLFFIWRDIQIRLLLLRFWLWLKQKRHAKNNYIHYLAPRIASVATHIWHLLYHLIFEFLGYNFFRWLVFLKRLLWLGFWLLLKQKCTPKTIAYITLRHGLHPWLPIFGTYCTI